MTMTDQRPLDHARQPFNHKMNELVNDVIREATKATGQDRRRTARHDTDELTQIAHLAVLEAQVDAPHLHPDHDRAHLRWTIHQAIDEYIDQTATLSMVSVEDLTRDLAWDGDIGDQVTDAATAVDHVTTMVEAMPTTTGEVVRLVYGLDGADPVDPVDVADILDLGLDLVRVHLWIAERLFRHSSDDGRDRRAAPLSEVEYEAFHRVGDLAWYDLRELNLNNADLRQRDLSQAILSGMNLWGLKLCGARATGINLWGSQLDGADLSGADLRSATMERVSLCGAQLDNADLSQSELWQADLSSASADHTNLAGADLRSANLVGADLTRADLSGADLRGADLRRACLVSAQLTGANLQEANLAGADLRWADLAETDLCWVDLSVADLRGASLLGAVRSPRLDSIMARRAPRPERRATALARTA